MLPRRSICLLLPILMACGGTDDEDDVEQSCDTTELDWGRGGEAMLPGTDCLGCHQQGGKANSVFTVAGTVMTSSTCPTAVKGATVMITDNGGSSFELLSNEVGNFFSSDPVQLPLTVSVQLDGAIYEMASPSPQGSCGACHSEGSQLGFVPAG